MLPCFDPFNHTVKLFCVKFVFSVEAQLIFSRLFPFVNAGCSEFLRTSSVSRAFISDSTQRDSRCWRIACLPADLLHYPVACVFLKLMMCDCVLDDVQGSSRSAH